MTRKIINRSSPGTSDIFGADDLNYVNKLLTAVDQGATDPVEINTTWKFRHDKIRIANSGNTANSIIASGAATSDKTFTLPNATDTAVVLDAAQTLTTKTMDAGSNTFQRIYGQTPDVSTKRIYGYAGGYIGTSITPDTTSLFGIASGCTASSWTQAPSITYNLDTTNGRYTRIATTTTQPNAAGWSLNNANEVAVTREVGFRFKIKFRQVNAASQKNYIGFRNGGSFTLDSPLDTANGLVYLYSSVTHATNLYWHRNDGTGTATSVQWGTVDNANFHTLEITGDSTDMRVYWDGTLNATYTTDIPGVTTVLYPIIWQYTTTTSARSLDIAWWYVETNS